MVPDIGRSKVIFIFIAAQITNAAGADFFCCFYVSHRIYHVGRNVVIALFPGSAWGHTGGQDCVFFVKKTIGNAALDIELSIFTLIPSVVQKDINLPVLMLSKKTPDEVLITFPTIPQHLISIASPFLANYKYFEAGIIKEYLKIANMRTGATISKLSQCRHASTSG